MSELKYCHCPQIDDQDWHMKDLDFSGKFFYFEDVQHIFGKPAGLDKKIAEMKSQLLRKGYNMVNPEMVLHQSGFFSGRVFVEIEDPGQLDANVLTLEDAHMYTRVYKGSLGGVNRGIEELRAFVEDRTHIQPSVIYHWQVSCPICSKEKGGDKVILFAQV